MNLALSSCPEHPQARVDQRTSVQLDDTGLALA